MQQEHETVLAWARDVFLFLEDIFAISPAQPVKELKEEKFEYTDALGVRREVMLFDKMGRLVHPDLKFYEQWMFENQTRETFSSNTLTWQQTVFLEAYRRAIMTFGKDSFREAARWITVRSGHGIGKTSTLAIISIHFLICFDGAQIGMTANTEQQVEDVFMKEFAVWKRKLPNELQDMINQTQGHIRIGEEEDWFLRAQVARAEKPEALAGLHGKYVLIIVDEASGVLDKVFEVMKGALTGDNYIVIYDGNPTRNEGEFFESHKPQLADAFTQLHFNARHSPIVRPESIKKWEDQYPGQGGIPSDQVLIRVDGEFAGISETDEQGWMPLFANIPFRFEPERFQVINHAIIGVDPAGMGKDRSIVHVRDSVYLKEVLNEKTSMEKDLARKIETIRDVYNSTSADIAVEAFGIGAKVVAEISSKIGESPAAILTDKPREETKDRYHTYRSELGWLFREWVASGGIIITNRPQEWEAELSKMKFKRDLQGRIMLMPKVEFKKRYGFSPDRFEAACMTFFKEYPTMPVVLTKAQLEQKELEEFVAMANQRPRDPFSQDSMSSM